MEPMTKPDRMKVIEKVKQTMYCYFCPSCGENVTKVDSPYVCKFCGQKITWEGANNGEKEI